MPLISIHWSHWSFEFVWSSEGLRRMWGWPENRVTIGANRIAKAAKNGKSMVKVLPFRTAWICLLDLARMNPEEVDRGYEASRWARLDQVWIKVGAEVHANIMEHPNPTETRPFGNAEVIMDVATWPCTVSLWVIDAFVCFCCTLFLEELGRRWWQNEMKTSLLTCL